MVCIKTEIVCAPRASREDLLLSAGVNKDHTLECYHGRAIYLNPSEQKFKCIIRKIQMFDSETNTNILDMRDLSGGWAEPARLRFQKDLCRER